MHLDKTQISKKFPLDKIKDTKMPSFFFRLLPTHHSFTFNMGFLNELKLKARLSKTACGISHF